MNTMQHAFKAAGLNRQEYELAAAIQRFLNAGNPMTRMAIMRYLTGAADQENKRSYGPATHPNAKAGREGASFVGVVRVAVPASPHEKEAKSSPLANASIPSGHGGGHPSPSRPRRSLAWIVLAYVCVFGFWTGSESSLAGFGIDNVLKAELAFPLSSYPGETVGVIEHPVYVKPEFADSGLFNSACPPAFFLEQYILFVFAANSERRNEEALDCAPIDRLRGANSVTNHDPNLTNRRWALATIFEINIHSDTRHRVNKGGSKGDIRWENEGSFALNEKTNLKGSNHGQHASKFINGLQIVEPYWQPQPKLDAAIQIGKTAAILSLMFLAACVILHTQYGILIPILLALWLLIGAVKSDNFDDNDASKQMDDDKRLILRRSEAV